jgi:putative transcriptional regulator
MLQLNVLEILKNKGKSKYWLYTQLNMTYTNFNNIVTNKTKSIKYDNIEKLCQILECTPDNLFVEVPDIKSKSNK